MLVLYVSTIWNVLYLGSTTSGEALLVAVDAQHIPGRVQICIWRTLAASTGLVHAITTILKAVACRIIRGQHQQGTILLRNIGSMQDAYFRCATAFLFSS